MIHSTTNIWQDSTIYNLFQKITETILYEDYTKREEGSAKGNQVSNWGMRQDWKHNQAVDRHSLKNTKTTSVNPEVVEPKLRQEAANKWKEDRLTEWNGSGGSWILGGSRGGHNEHV